MMNIMLLSVSVWSGAGGVTRELFHWLSALIALPVVAYAGRPVLCLRRDGAALSPDQHGRADLHRRAAGDRAQPVRNARPAASMPISTARSCCCSSCWPAARWMRRCATARARASARCWAAWAAAPGVVQPDGSIRTDAPQSARAGHADAGRGGRGAGRRRRESKTARERTIDNAMLTGESAPEPRRPAATWCMPARSI